MLKKLTALTAIILIITAMVIPAALAAELVSVEVVSGTENAIIEVYPGDTVNFKIKLSATGAISGDVTQSNPCKVKIHTVFKVIGSTGSSDTLSGEYIFYADLNNPTGGGNYKVTWNGAPTPYEVSATATASNDATPGDYTIRIIADIYNPNPAKAKMADDTADELTIRVLSPPTNQSPDAAFSWSPNQGSEGSAVQFTDGSTDSDGTIVSWSWNFGGLGTSDKQNPSFTFQDNGVYTVTLTVTDDDGATATVSHDVTILNVAPTVDAGSDATIDEGDTFTSSGSFTDPGADTWTATVDYGDGSGTQTLTLKEDKTFSLSHTYADNGEYTVTVTVTDDDGGVGTDTVTVTVNNVAPKITSLTCPLDPVKVGTPVDFTVQWSDPGSMDTQTIEWSWGDDSFTRINIGTGGSGSSTTQHTYLSPGVYTVSVTVTDKDGGSDSKTCEYYIVVYDPNAGFVTGGGWIWSPKGAYAADPTLGGKATFGFVSKYQKGATVPTGNTEFQFHAAGMNFKSTSYQWLVIAGSKAMFKGTGTINGEGSYGFLLSAIDGGTKGDMFRIKIWDAVTGNVVYDNQMGASDTADPTTMIAGGSIVIHSK